jgi:hypothetical protein
VGRGALRGPAEGWASAKRQAWTRRWEIAVAFPDETGYTAAGIHFPIERIYGVEAMKRLRVLLCALLLASLGCASEGSRGQWDEFWKDLRGDNMKMRNDFSGRTSSDDKR